MILVAEKVCNTCGILKPLTEFHKQNTGIHGRLSQCKECRKKYVVANADMIRDREREWAKNDGKMYKKASRRKSRIKKKYGVTEDQVNTLLENQEFRCCICKTDDPGATGWQIDHDHDVGDVRGILCRKCNLGLGLFGDDHRVLRAASEYLRKSGLATEDRILREAGITR